MFRRDSSVSVDSDERKPAMKLKSLDLVEQFVTQARHSLSEHHLPRILECLRVLSDEDTWWRPHSTSNSVGNLTLHLSGNVRQWIISGLRGEADRRERDKEFAERGPVPRRALVIRLRRAVVEAARVLEGLGTQELIRAYSIQGFDVTGLEAVAHVVDHFAYHTGQIIFITKLRLGEDLGFTRLPGEKKRGGRRRLSQV
jgi:uncharacterized damage-inducible protein DinB